MELIDMNKDERSLLLFFETCAVDHVGLVDVRHMNGNDMVLAVHWNEIGFIKFGRVKFYDIKKNFTHWCELSDEAWRLAHQERRARYDRTNAKRDWLRTEKLHAALGGSR
jgi:hypothetical protein